MKRTRRTRITVETERLLVVSHQRGVESWCEGCSARVKMVSHGEAATIAAVSHREIFRQIESHELHFTETPQGVPLICLDSLLKQAQITGLNGKSSVPD